MSEIIEVRVKIPENEAVRKIISGYGSRWGNDDFYTLHMSEQEWKRVKKLCSRLEKLVEVK